MKVVRPFLFILMALALVMVSSLVQRGLGPTLDSLSPTRQRTFQPTRLHSITARHYAGDRLLSVLHAEQFEIAGSVPHGEGGGSGTSPAEAEQHGLLRGVVIEVQADGERRPGQETDDRPIDQVTAVSLQLWDITDASFGRWSNLASLELIGVQLKVMQGGRQRAHLSSKRGAVDVARSRITFRGDVQLRTGDKLVRCSEAVWDSQSGSFRVPGAFTLEGAHGSIHGKNLQTDLLLARLQFRPPAPQGSEPKPSP